MIRIRLKYKRYYENTLFKDITNQRIVYQRNKKVLIIV